MSRTFTIALTPGRLATLAAGLFALLCGTAGASFWIARTGGERGERGEHAERERARHDPGAHAEEGEGEGEHHEEGKITLSPKALETSGIEVLTAGPGRVTVTLELPGEVSVNADTLAHVTPRVGGTVRAVRKNLGDAVKSGEVLATLDSRELAELQRELSAAKERLSLARASWKREEQLWNEKISAEKDYLAARQQLNEAEIDYRSAAQKLHAAGAGNRGEGGAGYALIAPFDGTIIEKHISIGEVLREDSQAFVIADLSTLWVNVTVYARDLSMIRAGQPVTVTAEGVAESAQGEIGYVGQVVGEQTRSAIARVVLHNAGPAWRPGLFVTARVAIEEIDVPVVASDDAVQTLEGKQVVFIQEEPANAELRPTSTEEPANAELRPTSTEEPANAELRPTSTREAFEARPVVLGRKGNRSGERNGRVVEIVEGLAPGDRYAGKNSFILKAELGKSEAGHEH